MYTQTETRTLIDDVFEEAALILGGLVAVRDVPDDVVRRLVEGLERVHDKAIQRLLSRNDDIRMSQMDSRPHPAIEGFLQRLREK